MAFKPGLKFTSKWTILDNNRTNIPQLFYNYFSLVVNIYYVLVYMVLGYRKDIVFTLLRLEKRGYYSVENEMATADPKNEL